MKLLHLRHEAYSCRIMLMALAIVFTWCVGSAHPASEPGTVTILLKDEPVTLDPYENSRTHEGQVLTRNVLEMLTEVNPADSSIMPRLATSWKQIDAHTWRFSLRKGVKFHDGKDFNAEAVVFNIKRIYDKRITSSTRTRFFFGVQLEGKAHLGNAGQINIFKRGAIQGRPIPAAHRIVWDHRHRAHAGVCLEI